MIVGLIILGFLMRSVLIGQVVIILYAIAVFVLKIESRTTFLLVLISFGIVLMGVMTSDTALASLFSTYALLLLIVGIISLGLETKRESIED